MTQSHQNKLSTATFGAAITRPEALETLPIQNLMARMQQGQWRKPIEAIRNQQNPVLRKEMKQRLPYFVFAEFDGRREESKLIRANGIVLDLDHLSDDEIAGLKELIPINCHWAKWLFRSPVDGLKVVVPFSRPVTDKEEYARIFTHLRERIWAEVAFAVDNTPDMTRACFVSWDEAFKAVDGALPFDPDSVPESGTVEQGKSGKEAAQGADPSSASLAATNLSTVPPLHLSTLTDPTQTQAISAVEYLAQRTLEHRDWIRCGIALYNHFGEDGIVYWLQFAYNPHYSDTPEDLRKVWQRLKKYPSVGIGTLFYIAEREGWINAVGALEFKAPNQIAHTQEGSDAPWTSGVTGAGAAIEVQPGQATSESNETGRAGLNSNAGGADPSSASPGATGLSTVPPLHLSTPSPSCNSCDSWTAPTLADFPELLELFGRPSNVPLDRSQLPDFLNRYLDLVGKVTDAQDGAKLTAFLPVAAANIGNRVYMQNAGTRHYCNIWAAIIGPSTVSRKTTVINQAMKMLQPFKDSLRELSPKERNERDLELCRVTQARLYNLLGINSNRLLLHMELSAWMQEMNKAYNAGMKQEITDMFDGKDRNIAKMEIDEYISRPAFSIIGATTEDWFYRELREVADQRGGFLQRFVICIIQNIDVDELRFAACDDPDCDRELHAWDEPLGVFRSLPDSHRLPASAEALELRDGIYRELMTRIALNANDPQAAYCARIFDNYFWRFCILIHLLKRWEDLRDARDCLRLQTWFQANEVDARTAKEAWYLCEYYFANTQPFLKSLSEHSKLDEERKLLRILQKAPGQEMTHSRLLCMAHMTSREFRGAIESMIERQAIICHEDVGYRNKIGLRYTLNPVLNSIEIN